MTESHQADSAVRRVILSEILIAILALAAYGGYKFLYAQKPEVQEKETETALLNVDVFETSTIDFQELLTGFGTARAEREVILAAQVSGEIIEVHPELKVGYLAKAAEPSPDGAADQNRLLKIDPRDYQQQVDQAAARIAESESELDRLDVQRGSVRKQMTKAKAVLGTLKEEYERIQDGANRKVSTPAELNRALLEVQRYEDTIIQLDNQMSSWPLQRTAAEQRLATSVSQKERADTDLLRTDVVPPFSGIISEVFVEQGQYVRAGEPLVRLTDLSRVEVPVSLSFDDFLQLQRRLAEGHPPEVSLSENATSAGRWTGTVVRLAPEADPMSRTVQAFVEVENDQDSQQLLQGAFVYARIDGQLHRQAMLIPREAISDGRVYVIDSQGIAREREITPGRRIQSMTIVHSGLNAGDRVALTNLDVVEEGREVVVQSTQTLDDELRALRNPLIRKTEID